jgi:hypothetical protein
MSTDVSAAAFQAIWGFICGVVTIGYFIWLAVILSDIRKELSEINQTLKERLTPPPRPVPASQLFMTPEKPADLNQRREEKGAKLTPELQKSLAFAPKESPEEKQPLAKHLW